MWNMKDCSKRPEGEVVMGRRAGGEPAPVWATAAR
jgi:hypothetical protein